MSQGLTALAANTSSANLVAGQLYEFIQRGTPIVLSGTASAVGLRFSLLVGGVAIINDQEISAANRFPILPDDAITVLRRGQAPGGRIVLTARNTTAGAINHAWALDVG